MISSFCSERRRGLLSGAMRRGMSSLLSLFRARPCRGHGVLPPPERAPHPHPLPTARKSSREEGSHPRLGLFAPVSTAIVVSFAQIAIAQTPAPQPAAPQTRVTIGYVDIAGDPRHEPIKAYERI